MKIAVSEHQNNVALTCDFSNSVTIFTCNNGIVINKERIELNDHFIPLRCAALRERGVEVLLCGAISSSFVIMLQHRGIKVISGVSGDIEKAVTDFLREGTGLSPAGIPAYPESERMRNRGKKGCIGQKRNIHT